MTFPVAPQSTVRQRMPALGRPASEPPAPASRLVCSQATSPGLPRRGAVVHSPGFEITPMPVRDADFAATRRSVERGMQTLLHDAHVHPGPGYSFTQVRYFAQPLWVSMRAQLALMDEAGVDEILYMPIPTTITGGPHGCADGDTSRLGRTYYTPDSLRDNQERLTPQRLRELAAVPQYINTGVDWEVAQAWKMLTPPEQCRIHPCITGFNLGDSQGVHGVMRLKNAYRGVFCWAGEATRNKEIVEDQNCCYKPGADDDAGLHNQLAFAGRSGMGFTLHSDVSSADECVRTGLPGRSEHLPDLHRIFLRHPGTVIVWPHLGLGRSTPPSARHVEDLRMLLYSCRNLHIDLSWDAAAVHYSPHAQPARNLNTSQVAVFDARADVRDRQRRIRDLASLIESYSDRFLCASDSLCPWRSTPLNQPYGIYSNLGQGPGTTAPAGQRFALFDHLSAPTLALVLNGNFSRLTRNARAASLAYENDGLEQDMEAIQQQAQARGRTLNNWSVAGSC